PRWQDQRRAGPAHLASRQPRSVARPQWDVEVERTRLGFGRPPERVGTDTHHLEDGLWRSCGTTSSAAGRSGPGDGDAESAEFSVDAPVSPRRSLLSETDDHVAGLHRG